MADTGLIEQLRSELPRLLREHPEVRHELWGLMLEAFPSRQEFMALLEELRAFREDSNRRFEAMDRRFEELRADMNQRFEAVDRRFEELRADMNQRFEAVFEVLGDHGKRLRELDLHLSALSGRVGYGLERVVTEVVEEFAGTSFPSAGRLVLRDEAGELFGVAGADVEFDLYAHNGTAYLVEVKSHLKAGDVLNFHRKAKFAEGKLDRPLIPLVIALSMTPGAERTMRELGMRYRVRSVVE